MNSVARVRKLELDKGALGDGPVVLFGWAVAGGGGPGGLRADRDD